MPITVKFHGCSAPSVEAWRQWLLAQPPHDPGMPALMIDALTAELIRTDGLPTGYDAPSRPVAATVRLAVHIERLGVVRPAGQP